MLCLIVAFVCGIALAQGVISPPPSPFNMQFANSSVWFSAAASCGKDNYGSHVWKGPSTGFVYKGLIYDKKTDTQGYYGVQSSTSQIWVVFRGTISTMNWIDDAECRLVDAEYVQCADCKVHRGFKRCHDGVSASVVSAVTALHTEYPNYQIMVTGHSLGGALANLMSNTLATHGFKVLHYSFGSPRVGNKEFAEYTKSLHNGNYYPQRITHFKDVVPHQPFESFGYMHIYNEVYEQENHKLNSCNGNDDGVNCAEQWALYQTNTNDHVLYLNLPMHCENV